jgi:hypothetical protein
VRCRLCDSNRLLSVLDLGVAPPCEKLLTVDELDLPAPTFPLHLQVVDGSKKSLIDAVRRLLHDVQLREEMSTATYRTATARYGMEIIANRLLDIYQRGGYRGYVTRARARA